MSKGAQQDKKSKIRSWK